jgi:hypothetical protein
MTKINVVDGTVKIHPQNSGIISKFNGHELTESYSTNSGPKRLSELDVHVLSNPEYQ